MRNQLSITLGTGAAQDRIGSHRNASPITGRSDLQGCADRLDPEPIAMLVDKSLQDLNRRSSSAWAKNALASFRISLARRRSLTSRSSSLSRFASADVTPGCAPESAPWRRRRTSGAQRAPCAWLPVREENASYASRTAGVIWSRLGANIACAGTSDFAKIASTTRMTTPGLISSRS